MSPRDDSGELDGSGVIETFELEAYVGRWVLGEVSIGEALAVVNAWKAGC